ncbi:MAG TPA: 1,4-alpha-glucan branching protein domain-containing protein [Thermoleophilaceae bacterium]|nr:1,4-alpha-glucan branching protein domain-containing protein [Thermoleophilaceae bacterium]
MSPDRGSLALVLHSHMPYVEGFGTWPFGEEWLWEATALVYLPLIELLSEADAPLTLGVTPVLADQLEMLPGDPGDRLAGFLTGPRAEVHDMDSRGLEQTGQPELAAEVRRAGGDYSWAAERLAAPGGRGLVGALAQLERETPVELWTSAATHALLPLMASDAGVRLQLATGTASHERRFGSFSGGLWLPECAYTPGLERELADVGVTVTCVDQTKVHGFGAPEQLEPVLTPAGVVAVPIDWQTVQLVWNGLTGYPATTSYRDYHHRTTHDLRPWNIGGGPYRPADAAEQARAHARDFVGRCIERLDAYAADRGRPGLLCFALDTELLGHWWYEGQQWLRAVLAEAGEQGLDLTTVSEGVERVEPVQRELEASSWGTEKDFSTWDSPAVAEVAFAARRAELRTVAAAAAGGAGRGALARAARELMALQASDWAFQITGRLSADYPERRLAGHSAELDAALRALPDSAAVQPDPALRNLAPDLDLAPLVAP